MSQTDFRKRLQQAEARVKPGLFDQVLAARAGKKRMRKWFAIAGVSFVMLAGSAIFWWSSASHHETAQVSMEVQKESASVNPDSKKSSGLQDAYGAAVPSTRSVNQASGRKYEKGVQKPGKYVRKSIRNSGINPETSNNGVPQHGWTLYPPLSALEKPLNTPESAQTDKSVWADGLGAKGFGLFPARFRKPDAPIKSAFNTGYRPVHNNWLIEVLADPAHMQVRSGVVQYNKQLNRTEQQQAAMQAVIRAGSQLGRNFRWFAGFKWSEQISRFDHALVNVQKKTVVDEVQVIVREPGLPDRQVSVFDTATLVSETRIHYSSVNHVRMIGIPLGLQYAPAGKSGSLYVFGSLVPAYVLRSRGMRVLPGGEVAFLEAPGALRRFQLNTELGFGVRRTLAPGLFLTMEPRLGYGLLNLSRMPVRQQGVNIGMSLGLSFRPLR